MNKSQITNLSAAIFIALGYTLSAYVDPILGDHVKTIGFFALSGAITNWLAIYMLFDKVPGLYGSGVIPAHFEEIKEWIRNMVMDQFFTKENLDHYLSEGQDSFMESIDINSAIDGLDFEGIFKTIKSEILSSGFGSMLAMFGGESFLDRYKEPFKEKMKEKIILEVNKPGFIQGIIDSGNIDVSKIIIERVSEIVQKRLEILTPEMVKEIVQEMIKRHLGWLVVWGGVFGGLIGLVMSFVSF